MDEEMKALVSRLAEYLRRSEQQLRCFHKYESQVEGWFKGELICFLEQERLAGHLSDFKPERLVGIGKTKIDIVLHFNNDMPIQWVELKHWIGYQNNTSYSPSGYFTTTTKKKDRLYAKHCVEWLLAIPENGDKFMLVLFTPNPLSKKWKSGVEKFNKSYPDVCSLTNPDEYPDYFFLGLLHVSD